MKNKLFSVFLIFLVYLCLSCESKPEIKEVQLLQNSVPTRLNKMKDYLIGAKQEQSPNKIIFVIKQYDCSECIERVFGAIEMIEKQNKNFDKDKNVLIYAESEYHQKDYSKKYKVNIIGADKTPNNIKKLSVDTPLLLFTDKNSITKNVIFIKKPYPADSSDIKMIIEESSKLSQ